MKIDFHFDCPKVLIFTTTWGPIKSDPNRRIALNSKNPYTMKPKMGALESGTALILSGLNNRI